ncbi:hypothetical protein llap_21850 [Limosa lapponica baueri]|uniref:Uncharacterized protein n=1 Tax=Limosa lapponica baueri TaxID=1758121 RepID=A0A2I0T219_LIMLA|nr:hypothetical protein llap_21850 [Limosa lapponica baueri]
MAESWAKKQRREETRGWGNCLGQVKVYVKWQEERPRSYLDPETVWRPEATTAASRREVKEGRGGSSMVSQVQKRALAGQKKPSLVSYPCKKGLPGEEGYTGQPEGLGLPRTVGHASLGANEDVGEQRSRRNPQFLCRPRLSWVCCCQSPVEVCPAQAILAGTVCLTNLMSPWLNAWQILT